MSEACAGLKAVADHLVIGLGYRIDILAWPMQFVVEEKLDGLGIEVAFPQVTVTAAILVLISATCGHRCARPTQRVGLFFGLGKEALGDQIVPTRKGLLEVAGDARNRE